MTSLRSEVKLTLMNKFDIKSLKKNLRLKRLFQYYLDEIKMTSHSINEYGHPEFYSFRSILKAGYPLDRDKLIKKDTNVPEDMKDLPASKKTILDEYQYGDWRNYIYETDNNFFNSITEKEHKDILKDIFEGQILPKMNKNFKREIVIKFKTDSYALISSKLNKKYYLFHCSRKLDGNKKKYEDLGYGEKFYYLLKIFTKKINKEQITKIANKNIWD
jgi:hypothetical protein